MQNMENQNMKIEERRHSQYNNTPYVIQYAICHSLELSHVILKLNYIKKSDFFIFWRNPRAEVSSQCVSHRQEDHVVCAYLMVTVV